MGTYLFFWGGFQKLIHILKLNKKLYYKDANLVSTSLLSHRTKTMASTMATIAILVAVGTTAISFGYTLFATAGDTINNQNHFDLYFYTDDTDLTEKVHDVFEKYDNEITNEIQFERYVTQPELVDFPTNYGEFLEKRNVFRIYSENQYNKIVDNSNHDGEYMDIKKGNVTIVYNSFRNKVDFSKAKMKFADRELAVTAVPGYEYSFGFLLMAVIDDEDFNALLNSGEIATKLNGKEYWPVTGINYTDNLSSKDIAVELDKLLSDKDIVSGVAYENYTALITIFGLICFIGFFMCAIFILMTASMLYFKQVTIATEEKQQYNTLKKIGIDDDLKNKIIRKRLLPVFLIPLLIGILHSVFAMKAADTLIFSMMTPIENSFFSVLKTSGLMYLAYGSVYAIFYFVTKGQYKRIIK